MFSANVKGSTKITEAYLTKLANLDISKLVEGYAQEGVRALSRATPVESSLASQSWGYEIQRQGRGFTIIWTNSDVESGFPVVIMLQHGYSTGTGGYVQGRDFINPAIQPIMDKISEKIWKAVTS